MTPLHCVFLPNKALCVNHCWAIRHLKALSDTSQNSATFLSFWLFCIILLFFPSIWIVVETNKGNCRSFIPITPKVNWPFIKGRPHLSVQRRVLKLLCWPQIRPTDQSLIWNKAVITLQLEKEEELWHEDLLVALLMDMTPLDPWMTSSPGVESHQGLVIRVILYLFQLHLLQVNANR